jgi:hypothetical protein
MRHKLIGPHRKPGPRPPDGTDIRIRWARWAGYQGDERHVYRYFTMTLVDQIEACKDDASRRIILGVSK